MWCIIWGGGLIPVIKSYTYKVEKITFSRTCRLVCYKFYNKQLYCLEFFGKRVQNCKPEKFCEDYTRLNFMEGTLLFGHFSFCCNEN